MVATAQVPTAKKATRPSDTAKIAPLLPKVVVRLRGNVDPTSFAAANGLSIERRFASRVDTWVMLASSVAAATEATVRLAKSPQVEEVFQDRILPVAKYWVPNDPYYTFNSPAGQWGQWHLRNTGNAGGLGIDARVWPVAVLISFRCGPPF